jgi:4-amino-4-deoxy-L-arabinose transferase-like glycosyltransferase
MDFIKKNSIFFIALGIFSLFFFSRFYNILGLPIFTDEAIYIRWSQIAANDAAWRFISLTDGKQPMFVWIAMLLMKVIDDPLLAGRTVSVIAGFISTIGIFFLASEAFKNQKIGFLASLIYVLYPFSLVYDRMALYDSLVAMFIIWALYFEVLLVRHLRLDLALILGMIIGGGMLTKTNANFALILLPFSLLLFNYKDKKWKEKFWRWIIYAVVAVVIANAIYLILRLSPFFYIIAEKNLIFIYSFSEWREHPFTYLWSNLRGMIDWLINYATIPFLILAASAFVVSKKYFYEKILLLVWFIVPFMALAFFGKNIYPRFIFFMTMPLLVLGAYSLYSLMLFAKKFWIKVLIFLVFVGMFFVTDFFIITDFSKASLPKSDLGQFIRGWPSGDGVNQTVALLKEKAKSEKIYVGTGGSFGLMPSALEIYLGGNPNVTIKGFWPVDEFPPEEVLEASKIMPTYFVFFQECSSCEQTGIAPKTWPVKTIYQVEKLERGRYFTLYQIEQK